MTKQNLGQLIVFEGVDGVGKTTQINLLSKFLTDQGLEHIVTREPGGCKISEELRSLILFHEMDSNLESLLFLAARYEHFVKVIQPALAENKIVLCDRFILSTLVYQNISGDRIIRKHILELHEMFHIPYPHIIFFLHCNVEKIYERISLRNKENIPNKYDVKDISFYKRLQTRFLAEINFLENHPLDIISLDADDEITMIATKISETFIT